MSFFSCFCEGDKLPVCSRLSISAMTRIRSSTPCRCCSSTNLSLCCSPFGILRFYWDQIAHGETLAGRNSRAFSVDGCLPQPHFQRRQPEFWEIRAVSDTEACCAPVDLKVCKASVTFADGFGADFKRRMYQRTFSAEMSASVIRKEFRHAISHSRSRFHRRLASL